jgi:hypothetical protein
MRKLERLRVRHLLLWQVARVIVKVAQQHGPSSVWGRSLHRAVFRAIPGAQPFTVGVIVAVPRGGVGVFGLGEGTGAERGLRAGLPGRVRRVESMDAATATALLEVAIVSLARLMSPRPAARLAGSAVWPIPALGCSSPGQPSGFRLCRCRPRLRPGLAAVIDLAGAVRLVLVAEISRVR